ncbi:GtrA family protein [Salinigranum marinum]|uniref:GtrA family protein n=1 Tax=Salinigranum marinum TaxID=1515595 RepID=UPI002989EFF1|nr:GtrA family protein [Salinigranum marinum]
MRGTSLFKEYVPSGSRNRRLLQYVLVGALGLGINQGVLFLATGIVGLSYVVGGTLSRVVSVLANYGINDAWTWRNRGGAGAREYVVRGGKYVVTRIVGIAIGLAALVVFVELLGLHYLIANVLAVGVGVAWGFGASERWVWRSEEATELRPRRTAARVGGRLASHGLDADGIRRRLRRLRFRGEEPAEATSDEDATAAFDGGQLHQRVPRLDGHKLRERLAATDRATLLVFALAGALFVGFTVYTSLLYRGYYLTGADYGSYLHMFWTTVNGHGFLQQGKFRVSHPSMVYWGGHFSLTLLVFLPFFAIWQSPYALLVMKSFLLAGSVPLLWFVARQHIESRRLAGLVVLSYAFNPFLWSAWAFDFQEQSLLPVLVLGGYLLYARGRRVGFLVLLTLAMFTNEFVIPLAFGFLLGLTASEFTHGEFPSADRRTILAGFGLVVVAHVVAGFVISYFSTVSGVPVGVLATPFQPLVEGHRISFGSLLPIALLNPDAVFQALTINIRGKIIYLVFFSLPFLFVAYADEVTLGSLAPFVAFAWLASNRPAYVEFRAHYPLYLLPFVYIGAVRAVGRWGHLVPRVSDIQPPEIPWRPIAKVGVAILLVNAGVFIVIGGGNMKPTTPKATHHEVIDQGLASIPQDASVITQNDLYPHIARHPQSAFVVAQGPFAAYEREVGPVTPDYIVYDTELHKPWVDVLFDSLGDRIETDYGLYKYEDGFWMFKRGFEGTPTAVTSDTPLTWVSDEHQFDAEAFVTGTTSYERNYVVSRTGSAGDRLWYGPYALLAPGTYTATFDVFATGTGDQPAATLDIAVGKNHQVVASRQIGSQPGWQEVTLRFTLDRPQDKVEFRGARASDAGLVALRGVAVEKQSPSEAAADRDPPAAVGVPDPVAVDFSTDPVVDRSSDTGADDGTTAAVAGEGTEPVRATAENHAAAAERTHSHRPTIDLVVDPATHTETAQS